MLMTGEVPEHLAGGRTSGDDPSPIVITAATRGDEWDRFVRTHPGATSDHLWGWRRILETVFGHECRYLVAHRAGAVVGVLPLVNVRSLLFGRSVTSLPFLNYGGVLAETPDVVLPLVDAARAEAIAFKASHVELRHLAPQCDGLPARRHKVRMALDLPGSADALWTTLDRKIRNQVRKAQKEGLEVATGGLELVDEFYAVFSRNMRDLGTPVYPRSLFSETVSEFNDASRLFVVRHQGRPVAAGITITFRGVVLNPWASSLREYRHLCANMLLYWAMLEAAVADGRSTFDFGRSSVGGGTHHFKVQWGAREYPLCWEYVLLSRAEPPDQGPSNRKFEQVIALWRRLPIAIANRIGPFLAKQLP